MICHSSGIEACPQSASLIGTPQSSTHRDHDGEDGHNSHKSSTLEDITFDLCSYDSEPVDQVQRLNLNSPHIPIQAPGPSPSGDIISHSGTSESVQIRQLQLEVGFAPAAFTHDDVILGSQLQNMTLAFSNPSNTPIQPSSFTGHAHIQEAPEYAMAVLLSFS